MTNLAIIHAKLRSPPQRGKANVLARIRRLRIPDIEPDEEHFLEGMLHWRDPVERLRALRRSHTLVDDNPASG